MKATKVLLYCFKTFVFVISFGLTVLNRTGDISILGILVTVIGCIFLRFGGNKIISLLNSVPANSGTVNSGTVNNERRIIGETIGITNNIFTFSGFMIILGSLTYNAFMVQAHNDGVINGYGISVGVHLMFLGWLGCCYAILYYILNVNPIFGKSKMKVTPIKPQLAETVLSGTGKASMDVEADEHTDKFGWGVNKGALIRE